MIKNVPISSKTIQKSSICIQKCSNMFNKAQTWLFGFKNIQMCSKTYKNHEKQLEIFHMSENMQMCMKKFRNRCKKFKTFKDDQEIFQNVPKRSKLMTDI